MLLVRLGSNTDTTFWGKLHISSYNTWFCVHKLDWKLSFKYPVVSQKASETKRVTVGLMKLRWSQELEHFILVPEHQFSCQCLCLYMWSGQTVFPPLSSSSVCFIKLWFFSHHPSLTHLQADPFTQESGTFLDLSVFHMPGRIFHFTAGGTINRILKELKIVLHL